MVRWARKSNSCHSTERFLPSVIKIATAKARKTPLNKQFFSFTNTPSKKRNISEIILTFCVKTAFFIVLFDFLSTFWHKLHTFDIFDRSMRRNNNILCRCRVIEPFEPQSETLGDTKFTNFWVCA